MFSWKYYNLTGSLLSILLVQLLLKPLPFSLIVLFVHLAVLIRLCLVQLICFAIFL